MMIYLIKKNKFINALNGNHKSTINSHKLINNLGKIGKKYLNMLVADQVNNVDLIIKL